MLDNPTFKPNPASTVRDIPLNYKKKAQDMIQSMVDSYIIEEVTWATVYCSRASFMVKPDGESLRMVTDY